MLSTLNISQLIADDLGSVDFCIDIGMGVTIYPHINPAVSNIVMQVHRKCSIERALLMMRCNNCHCREMMSHHYNMLCITLRNTLLDELQTLPVLVIEVARHKRFSAISDLIEVTHALPDGKLIGRINL